MKALVLALALSLPGASPCEKLLKRSLVAGAQVRAPRSICRIEPVCAW